MTILICESCGCGAFLLSIDKAGRLLMICSACGAENVLIRKFRAAADCNCITTGECNSGEAGH
jgi:hypothetical protein